MFELLEPWGEQPNDAGVEIAPELAPLLRFALLPSLGYRNLATGAAAIRQSASLVLTPSTSGLLRQGGSRAEFAGDYHPSASGLTLIGVWRASAAQYTSAEGTLFAASNRTVGNTGWSWGKFSAVGGADTGNLTSQTLVLQGVAQYTEATPTIESLVDTPVACVYNRATGKISWWRFGARSSADTTASTSPTTGGSLVIGSQGSYTSRSGGWTHHLGALLVFGAALPDALVADLTMSATAPYKAFAGQRIWVPVSAGGSTTLTASLIDAAAGVDLSSASPVLAATLADAAAGIDLLAATATRNATLLDAASAADLCSAAATLLASRIDSAATADTLTAGLVANVTQLDAATAADVASAVATLAAQLTEGTSAADLLTATRIANAAVQEAAAGSDTTTTGTNYAASAVEAAATADALSAAATLVVQLVEAGSTLDQLAAAPLFVTLLTEAAQGTDTASVPVVRTAAATESAAALESLGAVFGAAPTGEANWVIEVQADNTLVLVPADNTLVLVPADNTLVLVPADNTLVLGPADNTLVLVPADHRRIVVPPDYRTPTVH